MKTHVWKFFIFFFASHLKLDSVLDLLGFILANNLFSETISEKDNFDSNALTFVTRYLIG